MVRDDGGHQQCQIWTTFVKLWPNLRAGGLYFIEDIHVSHDPNWNQVGSPLCKEGLNVVDRLLYEMIRLGKGRKGKISDVDFVYCQRDACVLGKKSGAGVGDRRISEMERIMGGTEVLHYTTEKITSFGASDIGKLTTSIDGLIHRKRPDLKFVFCQEGACIMGEPTK